MEGLQVFKNNEFGEIRITTINNNTYFVGKDVARALGYGSGKSLNNAISNHVSEEDKGVTEIMTPGGTQRMTIINESGLYALIFGSKLESAKRFKRWVTSEVLPSIRKSGGYIQGQENMSDSELMAKALLVAQKQIEERNKQIETMQPKALFADAVSASNTSILVGDLAKLLKQNGIEIGQKRLFAWLRDKGYLIRQKGASWNMPTQRSMELKLFEVKETTITHSDGHISITKTVKVTGKGQVYFVNKFLESKQAVTS